MRGRLTGVALVLLAMTIPVVPRAAPAAPGLDDPAALCARAVAGTERTASLPPRLLGAISLVEAGRRVPGTGRVAAWPWTINVNGTGFFFDSREQAVAAVQALQAQGVQSIDVGCMQVNLFYHARAFPTLDAAFDPPANVAYAARFLRDLRAQTGTWPAAAAAYHSQTPELGADYLRRVAVLWPEGQVADAAPAAALPRIYTPELASQVAADRAGLQQVLARMRLPAPTDMAARRADLVRLPARLAAQLPVRAASLSGRRAGPAIAGYGDAGLPVPNASALAAFRPAAATPAVPSRPPARPVHLARRPAGGYQAASLSLEGELAGALR